MFIHVDFTFWVSNNDRWIRYFNMFLLNTDIDIWCNISFWNKFEIYLFRPITIDIKFQTLFVVFHFLLLNFIFLFVLWSFLFLFAWFLQLLFFLILKFLFFLLFWLLLLLLFGLLLFLCGFIIYW